jgi:RNA polymerase sigma factor (sigma-70 family)
MRMELIGRHALASGGARLNGHDDQVRFARVVRPHLADAYALARWLTGNETDAEDVVQDACLRAFRPIAGFKEGNARAWLLTIVRNTAYTWLGKNRSPALVVTDDLEGVEGVNGGGSDSERPDSKVIAASDAATQIEKLPTPFRETLELRDLQGLDSPPRPLGTSR